jgi:tetratricopeptide (TPR) repeat protein
VDLAICDNDLGRFYHVTYDRASASRYHNEALEIRKRNAFENPGGARFQDELARSYANLANVALEDGRIDEALQYTEESVAILEQVTQGAAPATAIDLPTDLGQAYNSIGMLRIALAGHYSRLAYLQCRIGRTELALESCRKSLAIVAALLATDPEDMNYRIAYASIGTDVCTSLDFMGHGDEANTIAEKVRPQVERLIKENPSVPGFKVNLARLLDFQGQQAFKAGRAHDAVPLLRQALSLYEGLSAENSNTAYYQHRVAAACRHIGLIPSPHVSEAESLTLLRRAESLLKNLRNPDTTSIYDLACTQAVIAGRLGRDPAAAAERDRYEQRAMDTLRRAISAGYKDLNIFRADTDLDALRPRRDFQALLASLGAEAAPANPAAPRGADR